MVKKNPGLFTSGICIKSDWIVYVEGEVNLFSRKRLIKFLFYVIEICLMVHTHSFVSMCKNLHFIVHIKNLINIKAYGFHIKYNTPCIFTSIDHWEIPWLDGQVLKQIHKPNFQMCRKRMNNLYSAMGAEKLIKIIIRTTINEAEC